MIGKQIKGAIGAGAFLVGALTASAIVWGNKRVDAWETLTPDDAEEGEFVTLSDGARMHYVYRGFSAPQRLARDSRDVVLIHGLMDSATSWSNNVAALAEAHRVWAVDLIGFGYSSRLTRPTYSLKYFARTVREFMDARGIERASFVGHSLGGAVALELAHDFPERVEKLVLIAPGTYRLNIPRAVNLAARIPYIPRAMIGMTMTSGRTRQLLRRGALGWNKHLAPQDFTRYLRPGRVKGTADALVAMAASPRESDLPEGLNQIAAPTLILWGDKDPAVPIVHGRHHERHLPNSKFVVLEGASHLPQVEFPAATNRLILEFLA